MALMVAVAVSPSKSRKPPSKSGRSTYWLSVLADQLPSDDTWLSEWERTRLNGFRSVDRQRDFRLGRWTAKQALKRWRSASQERVPWGAFEMHSDERGRPIAVADGRLLDLPISISHRKRRALCVLAPGVKLVGCDIEIVEGRSSSFINDHLTAPEKDTVKGSSLAPDQSITVLWSAKEAVYKALDQVVPIVASDIEVEFGPEGPIDSWRTFRARIGSLGGRQHQGWWRLIGTWVLTVVADSPTAAPVDLARLKPGPQASGSTL